MAEKAPRLKKDSLSRVPINARYVFTDQQNLHHFVTSFAPESSRLMVRLAGQELLVIAMAGPFMPGPAYTSR